jgi:THO complex subunit 2
LNAQALVAFIQSVLLALPSSSARVGPPVQNIVFGEILVDVLWSTDAQLDEFLADAKSALVGSEQASGGQQVKDAPKKDITDGAGKAAQLRHFVEQDKETLSELVKRLLVSISTQFYNILNLSTNSSLASLISLYVESALI